MRLSSRATLLLSSRALARDLLLAPFLIAAPLVAQDSRTVVEPKFPAACTTITAELSPVADTTYRNRADVPGVIFCLTSAMKESSMPTSAIEPVIAPMAAPTARPKIGM